MSEIKTDSDYRDKLRARGFGIVEDGNLAIIVTGKASEIPLDRPVGAFDLLSVTRARRFESAKVAVAILLGNRQMAEVK